MDIIPTLFLCLAALLALVMNIYFLVVFIRRKRLRTPTTLPISMVLVHLACIDLIATFLWTIFAAISAINSAWVISDEDSSLYKPLCDTQVYVMSFCNVITAHTLMALMFERFLWIFKPSKRQEIVFDLVVVVFLVALYVFDGGISSFVLWGFGTAIYFPEQYQCSVDYELSVSHFQFTLAMHYWIPIVVIIALYVAILIRVRILMTRRGPGGVIVLEENLKAVGDSYSDKLKEIYMKFQGAGAKSVKPKVKEVKPKSNDGFVSDDDDYNSSDDEKSKKDPANVMSRDYDEKPEKKRERKMYFLSRQDMRETHMYALISAVYFSLWTPYMVRSILYTYYFYDISISSEVVATVAILTHFSTSIKVPIYLMSDRLRKAMRKTLCCREEIKKNNKFDAPHQDENIKREETTEL
ncbi:uncharacterized protein LOC132756572 [Ruditapes philippinarum]|uniref:uncharacterized protein LOC132756572 n=1 Tax=Ruditapes philippinarum TaxID=129788 RepID=UPI00295C2122|nr:uncharacterized protein LOC132756572 [Ruditapes philippinarum]